MPDPQPDRKCSASVRLRAAHVRPLQLYKIKASRIAMMWEAFSYLFKWLAA